MKSEKTLLIDLSHQQDSTSTLKAFANDVASGLSNTPKTLPSRYFYDGMGSQLFQQIMDLPEYYLTRAEFTVFEKYKEKITEIFSEHGFFHLIDLGAGDALKTRILLEQMQQLEVHFDYVPVDISKDAMLQLSDDLADELPAVNVHAVIGEYFEALEWLNQNKTSRKIILFLGSNIGNFEPADGIDFLTSIRSFLNPGDLLLMGVDLRKDPAVIIPAYSDSAGVTAEFNTNLLERINRELGGEFNIDQFKHYAFYEPQLGAMESYLISKVTQDVYIDKLDKTFHFEAWEAIHTENSYKYSIEQMEEFALECGFKQKAIFQDDENGFADIIFSVV